jgi:hypothetical protein
MQPELWSLADDAPRARLRGQGFVCLSPGRLAEIAGRPLDFGALDARWWQDLPPDEHLRDGGRYRFRRHASLVLTDDGARVLRRVERPHWQPTDYNALHGGLLRDFAPVRAAALDDPDFAAIVTGLGRFFAAVRGAPVPFVEVHQFRIDTAAGIGRPTPEGAHRDGVDYVAVVLLSRVDVRGGETRVFDAAGPLGVRFTLAEAGSALVMDDARVVHETTPILAGHRDTLVLTYRAGGFLDPP